MFAPMRGAYESTPPAGETAARARRNAPSVDERDLDLDLDRAPSGQRGHPDRGAGVTTGVAQHVEEQLARAVDDRGLLLEAGGRSDESEHRENAGDPIERTETGSEHRERVQRAPAGRLRALVDRQVCAQYPR